ncbi:hypothetical protein EDC22_103117 [Tepidamorphus gemmatus]|uniref:Secreted protein n=1 Tax=Tepidamorphus gemmatus TaxID=747076 RepID=A0A4R3MJ86_9HYPH|nr:DUF1223 domain-containing protein [Tepidamorphus gemmatus]TCT11805.1 hypothetical protein EDC22_103117 [Tepidamorphus gemmatus]
MRFGVLTGLALAAAMLAALPGSASAQPTRIDVVELFTSQGCSSCPEADRILGELARQPSVLALSFSIDYWDYLGWKDTLAQPDFTARQKAYAHARGDRAVYTPQAVVNGLAHAAGSDRKTIEDMIRATGRQLDAQRVVLEADRSGDDIVIRAGAGKPPRTGAATIWFVTYEEQRTVEIKRGENRGRTNTYHNVVRHIEAVARWSGETVAVSVPMPRGKGSRCAVILQEGSPEEPGAILAAVRL